MEEYERKLGLVDKFIRSSQALYQIDKEIDEIMAATGERRILDKLAGIKKIIRSLEAQQEE